jgi:hypothetical protein
MEMSGAIHIQLGRFLVIIGIALVMLGLVVMSGVKLPFSNFGRLPGDIAFRGKHFQFYFPIVTCLVLSAIATAIIWLISYLKSR